MRERARVAIVVQRCHESVLGGSEALAWHYVRLLEDIASVEVLTSTAVDYESWKNDLPAGEEIRDGTLIRRFPVASERTKYFHELHGFLAGDLQESRLLDRWRPALQEEFIRKQGPWCPQLERFLLVNQGLYRKVVLFTYLYPTSYWPAKVVDPTRSVLVPTLHDEPAAHLDCYRQTYSRVGDFIWNAEHERQLASRIWGIDRGHTLGVAIDIPDAAPEQMAFPYILYCGRIDRFKGCEELFSFFSAYKRQRPGELKLILTGSANWEIPSDPDITYLGFVPQERKNRLMRGASAFVMPSQMESLSIATLEAMGHGTPVLARRGSEVVCEHVFASGCGDLYEDEQTFASAIDRFLAMSSAERQRMGKGGSEYVRREYAFPVIRRKLAGILRLDGRQA